MSIIKQKFHKYDYGVKMSDSESIFIITQGITDEDPNKNPKPRVDKETEYDYDFDEEFEDLPSEDDEIEDIFVYQNSKTRFIQHFY